jgi:(p)ppGpp synthase/HD superfamily hydrolase
VVAGILHDVIEDCIRENYTREMLEQRIGDKFGADVLDTVLAVTHRSVDDRGNDLSSEERKEDYLERLRDASDSARWVCAADKLHNAGTIVADLNRTIDPGTVWGRFNVGRSGTVRWYRGVYERLRELGFTAPIMDELRRVVEMLEAAAESSLADERASARR